MEFIWIQNMSKKKKYNNNVINLAALRYIIGNKVI